MTAADNKDGRTNRFEKQPALTLAAVIIIASLAGILILSCFFRVFSDNPQEENLLEAAFTFRRASPVFHHGLSKNQAVDDVPWGPLKYKIRTNSLGFRDADVRQIPLKAENYRILLMGDSFTEGIGLDYENTFPGIVAENLRAHDVEVLNGAAVSYSPIIYWRKTKYLIEEVGLKFDELAVFLDISDARDEAESYYLDERENVQSRLFEDRGTRKKILERIKKDKIVNSLSRYLAVLIDFSTSPAWETGRWTTDPELLEKYGRPGLKKMTNYMDRLRKLLETHGIKLTVAVYPWPVQILENDLDSIHAKYWENWCRQNRIELINYFPAFIAPGKADPRHVIDRYFIANDAHWNRQGHELIARIFCEKFLERQAGQ